MKTENWGGAPVVGRATPKGIVNTVGMFKTIDFATLRPASELLGEGFFDFLAHEIAVQDRIRYGCWDAAAQTWTNGWLIVAGNTHGQAPGVQGRVTVRAMTPAETPEGGQSFVYHIGRGQYDVIRGEKIAAGVSKDEAAALAGEAA